MWCIWYGGWYSQGIVRVRHILLYHTIGRIRCDAACYGTFTDPITSEVFPANREGNITVPGCSAYAFWRSKLMMRKCQAQMTCFCTFDFETFLIVTTDMLVLSFIMYNCCTAAHSLYMSTNNEICGKRKTRNIVCVDDVGVYNNDERGFVQHWDQCPNEWETVEMICYKEMMKVMDECCLSWVSTWCAH